MKLGDGVSGGRLVALRGVSLVGRQVFTVVGFVCLFIASAVIMSMFAAFLGKFFRPVADLAWVVGVIGAGCWSANKMAMVKTSLYVKWVSFVTILGPTSLLAINGDELKAGRIAWYISESAFSVVIALAAFIAGDLGERKLRLKLKAEEDAKRAELEAVEEALLDDALRANVGGEGE